MNELLDLLANRGTVRGADAVLDAAIASVGEDDERGDSTTGVATTRVLRERDLQTLTPEPFDGTTVVNMDAERPRRRRPWRTALTAGGLAAMLGVVSLGVASLLGGGGANSPDGAVRQLADAIGNQDPLAAVDVLAPDEVGGLRDSVDGISGRAQELQLVDDAGKPLAGVDFEVGDLQLDNEELAPGYVKVTLHGLLISAQAHREGVAELIRRVWTPDEGSKQAVIDTRDLPPDIGTFVVAVQRNGSWYVSPAYTALEYVRVVNDLPAAEYGSGRAAAAQLGADTPEAAVQDALTAWAAGDWGRLWRLAPPNEVPVYDYRAALDQALADTKGPHFTIDNFAATAHVDGDTAQVTVVANGVTENGSTWSLDDRCYSIADPDEPAPFGSACGTAGVFGSFTVGLGPFVSRDESSEDTPLHVTAVQRDGRWYISPVGTVLDIVDSVVSGTTQDQIYALLGLYGEVAVDGEVALGQPVQASTPLSKSMHVYTLDGHAGQRIVGELSETGASDAHPAGYVSTIVVQPDGTQTYDSWNLFEGPGLTLPVDGEYRIVLFTPSSNALSFTVYDAADAPPELLTRDDFGSTGGESCVQLEDGSTECTSSGFSSGIVSESSSGLGIVGPSDSESHTHEETTATSIATTATTSFGS